MPKLPTMIRCSITLTYLFCTNWRFLTCIDNGLPYLEFWKCTTSIFSSLFILHYKLLGIYFALLQPFENDLLILSTIYLSLPFLTLWKCTTMIFGQPHTMHSNILWMYFALPQFCPSCYLNLLIMKIWFCTTPNLYAPIGQDVRGGDPNAIM